MEKILFQFCAALLLPFILASCKDDISLPDTGNEAKLVVYCFPTAGNDTTWINVSQSLPVKQYHNNVHLRNIDNASITYFVNGEQREVINEGNGYYYVVGKQKVNDKITLTVHADSLHDAYAETYIPDTIAVGNASHRQISLYDDDYERSLDYEQLLTTFNDPTSSDDYYAVRAEIKYISGHGTAYAQNDISYTFNNEYEYQVALMHGVSWDSIVVHLDDSTYFYPDVNTESEPLLISKSKIDDAFGFSDDYFGGLYIFNDNSINGETYTLHININAERVREGNYMATYERLELLHLTPEYYNFLKSVNAIENSDLARYGLSQLMPTYSNVSGGLGVVGGWNVSHTNWINAHHYEE